jgi:hypothetical protein
MDDSFQELDNQHAQLRSFRNIVLLSALVVTLLVGVTLGVVSWKPSVMPLCFPSEVITDTEPIEMEDRQNCPTGDEKAPSGGDVLVVALLGALGGALAAAVSIRNLKGTSTAYDVPVALAMLKVPLGAFTAILALVAIQGDFVPGLSALDSQEQILAYALVFGFAQQVFTRLLDQRAQTLLEGLPGGTATEPPPRAPAEAGTQVTPGRDVDVDQQALKRHPTEPTPRADGTEDDVEVLSSDEPVEAAPEDDDLQDDEASPDDETGKIAEGP